MSTMDQKEWFLDWFDSPYYPILYQKRDDCEAQWFLDNLLQQLHCSPGASIIDIACGKGRHSKYLSQKGFKVTGIDLAGNAIAHAKQFENERLSFYVHDMRKPFRINYYDYAFNLFTSLGYFASQNDNFLAIKTLNNSLKVGGTGIIDFFNATKVRQDLVPEETKSMSGIDFKISKRIEGRILIKSIQFEAEQRTYDFQEKVQLLTINDFNQWFNAVGLKVEHLYGDYSLGSYHEATSERLIIQVRKTI